MKLLLVNSIAHFSVNDVYKGYFKAFPSLGVQCDGFDWSKLRGLMIHNMMDEICISMLHSRLCRQDSAYTHVAFINCNEIPNWFLDSLPADLVKIQISVDDPWAGWVWNNRREKYNMIFSNERLVAKKYNVNYLPTADDSLLPISAPAQESKSDVCFIGSLYPSRASFLRLLVPRILKEGFSFLGCGPVSDGVRCPDFWQNRIFDHDKYMSIIQSSKICLHLNRDPAWKCDGEDAPDGLGQEAESLCPRIYENAALKVFTLSDDQRPELPEIFGDNIPTFFNVNDCINKIRFYLKSDTSKMTNAAAEIAKTHTYINRAKRLISLL